MKITRRITQIVALACFAFLYLPLFVLVIHSFNRSEFGVAWEGFTLKWYPLALKNSQAMAAVRVSLLLAACSTALSTLLGTGLGFALAKRAFKRPALAHWLLYLPVCVPDIVMAVAIALIFRIAHAWVESFDLGLGAMVLAHVTFQTPFIALVVRARLADLDPLLEEAASDLGATTRQRYTRVLLPLALPGIVAGALLGFTLSLEDFVISFFTTGPGATTLPIYIYSSVKRGVTPEINALSAMIILVSVSATLIIMRLQGRGRTVM